MIDEKTMKKLLKKISKVEDFLEDENYHSESLFLSEFGNYIKKNPNIDVPTLVMWVVKYRWLG